jgi:hypothetical protein
MEANMGTPSKTQTSSGKIRKHSIFFSHKVNDKKVTYSLIDLLALHTENVEFFASEKITKGEEWMKVIADYLNRANFLVLVFTDPNENWGWCLYESGFFDALRRSRESSRRRIWCLHHASNLPPSPLRGLQTIPAIAEDVEQWLTELFEATGQTKVQYLKSIPKLAEKVCKLFSIDQRPIYSQRSIKIAANPKQLSADDLPDDAIVKGERLVMQELFGINADEKDWKSIKNQLEQFDNSSDVNVKTLKEMANAIYRVFKGAVVRPTMGIIFVGEGPKRYRPVLSSAKEVSKDQIECDIMFVEEAGGRLQNIPKPSEALLTAIRMAVRIRWEIVRPFASDVRGLAEDDPYKLRLDLQTCFNNIFLEAGFRANFSKTDLLDAFEPRDKRKLRDIIKKWNEAYPKIWSGIGFKNMKETFGEGPKGPMAPETFGEVPRGPMTPEDVSLLETALHEIEKLNRDFLAMAAARGELMIQSELRTKFGIDPEPEKSGASNLRLDEFVAAH